MNENAERRLAIARELLEWRNEIPALIRRIDRVLCVSGISDTMTAETESIADRIGLLLVAIRETINRDESYEQLTASVDRLRVEIAASEATLDRWLRPS
jgi:hypothetical protein